MCARVRCTTDVVLYSKDKTYFVDMRSTQRTRRSRRSSSTTRDPAVLMATQEGTADCYGRPNPRASTHGTAAAVSACMQRTTTRVVAALVAAAIVACGATSGSTSSTSADAGDDASGEGGGAVPTCNVLIMCPCADGTKQGGPSCAGGPSCDDACRPHGGQACFSAQACTCADGSKQWQGPCPHPTCEEVCAAHCDAGGCASDAGEDG
jgi:hypothetical protein